MVISDISMLAVSEQDAYSVKTGNDKTPLAGDHDTRFFEQFSLAKRAPETKDTPSTAQNKQHIETPTAVKESSIIKESLSGEEMLAQINAAHTIDTRVNNNITGSVEALDKNSIKNNSKPEDQLAPIVIAPSSDASFSTEGQSETVNNVLDNESMVVTTTLAPNRDLNNNVIDSVESLGNGSVKVIEKPEDQLAPIVINLPSDENKTTASESEKGKNGPANEQVNVSTASSGSLDNKVQNTLTGAAQSLDSNVIKLSGKPEDKLAPIVINQPSNVNISAEFQLEKAENEVANNISTVMNSASLQQNSLNNSGVVAQTVAVGEQQKQSTTLSAKEANFAIDAKASTTGEHKAINKTSLDSALLTLLSKDEQAIKADKLLANLTPTQQGELATKLDVMSKPINKDNLADLKQLLSKYVSESEKPQTPQQAINAQITTLTPSEKQALLNQLQGYIKSESLPSKELTSLKSVMSDLETAINSENVFSSKDKSSFANNALAAETTVKTQSSTESASVKPELKLENSKPVVDSPEELAKQFETLPKESMRATDTQQMPPRAAQLFSQIVNLFEQGSANTYAKFDYLGYEQAITEAQNLQVGQLQSAAQVKQVSLEPATLQALNIIKSDAAKMLQERVSSMLSINNKEAEIRLDPPEMGSMQIRIRSDAEQAQINFVVQNQQAKEALEQSLPRLREMLMQQGLELGESNISYGGSGAEQSEQHQGSSQGFAAENELSDEVNGESTENQTQGSKQQNSSSIDYYA